MSRRLFVLPSVGAGDKVLIASTTGGTPAEIVPNGSGGPIAGSVLQAGSDGSLPRVLGPDDGTATLYLLRLNYRGAVTGSPTTLTAVDPGTVTAVFATSSDVSAAVAGLVNGAAADRDTFGEVAGILSSLAGAYVAFVDATSDADAARPDGAVCVVWKCATGVLPTNAIIGTDLVNAGGTFGVAAPSDADGILWTIFPQTNGGTPFLGAESLGPIVSVEEGATAQSSVSYIESPDDGGTYAVTQPSLVPTGYVVGTVTDGDYAAYRIAQGIAGGGDGLTMHAGTYRVLYTASSWWNNDPSTDEAAFTAFLDAVDATSVTVLPVAWTVVP